MGILHLVRHGQASFGAQDYDQLSALGRRQCVRLGEYFRHRGKRFDAVLTGRLKRHAQSLEAIASGLPGTPEPLVWPGLDEYDSAALIGAIHPEPLAKPDTPELYRHHFRLLREALQQWMAGRTSPAGMPSYADFAAGVNAALDHVRREHEGDVLIVSSGGPISTAIGQVLGVPAETTIGLNMQIRNSAVSEFVFTPRRHTLLTYNTLPHLDRQDDASLVTHT
ncbi:MAG: histidine phosphatase family protein [Burkholderiaceae bacterium]|nr:histidine phosphatase family protein [Burkholderiaceae bacterium]